jgi:GrpB-like predicted nucleotidyltransferase (UPF0157 family)
MPEISDQIELVAYDPQWPALASVEISIVKAVLSFASFEFEHIGSTAVPGLNAKATIDLMAGTGSLNDARSAIGPLEQSGYSFWRGNPFKEHFFFVKGLPGLRFRIGLGFWCRLGALARLANIFPFRALPQARPKYLMKSRFLPDLAWVYESNLSPFVTISSQRLCG